MHTGCGLGPTDVHVAMIFTSKLVTRATELLELQKAIGIKANELSVYKTTKGSATAAMGELCYLKLAFFIAQLLTEWLHKLY